VPDDPGAWCGQFAEALQLPPAVFVQLMVAARGAIEASNEVTKPRKKAFVFIGFISNINDFSSTMKLIPLQREALRKPQFLHAIFCQKRDFFCGLAVARLGATVNYTAGVLFIATIPAADFYQMPFAGNKI